MVPLQAIKSSASARQRADIQPTKLLLNDLQDLLLVKLFWKSLDSS